MLSGEYGLLFALLQSGSGVALSPRMGQLRLALLYLSQRMKYGFYHLLVGGLIVALSLLSGCSQPLWLEGDWKRVYENASLPTKLESAPETLLKPLTIVAKPPATVLDPDRPERI